MKHNTNHFQIIIIGGGASGMMAAIRASKDSDRVLVIEHQSRAGIKILSTGNGRCNFTNTNLSPEQFRCADPEFCMPALRGFTAADTIRFFREELHILCREKEGYCYPRSNQASTVRDALLASLRDHHVTLHTGEEVVSVKKTNDVFFIETNQSVYTANACILCCGGKAAPKTGSDGSGYRLAKLLGHSIAKPLPALTALYAADEKLSSLAGVRAQAKISLYADGICQASDLGEIQFTDYGISGIPVFQVSRYAAIALHLKQRVTAEIDLIPEFSEEGWTAYLSAALRETAKDQTALMSGLLSGAMQKKIADHIISTAPNRAGWISEIVRMTKHMEIPIRKTAGFSQAQTTTGGVRVSEIDPASMGSRLVNGLFFAGEILDVDGACGGYNLQWAWSSAHLAGSSATSYIRERKQP